MTHALAVQLEEGYGRLQLSVAQLIYLLACPSPRHGWLDWLRKEVGLLHDDLTRTYALQEEDGYLDQVESQVPYWHERVKRLHEEQDRVILDLETLREDLFLAQPAALPTLCQRLGDLLGRIQDLEARKDKVVQEAFCIEPSAMD